MEPLQGKHTQETNKTDLQFTIVNDGYGAIKLTNQSLQNSYVPLDIVLLLDVSGSVAHYFDDFCKMIKDFVNKLTQYDRFSLITFSSETTQPFALQPVTQSIKQTMSSLIVQNQFWGDSTCMNKGAHHSLKVLKNGIVSGRSMYFMLVTDGKPDVGCAGETELKEIIEIPNVVVKMCTFGSSVNAEVLTNILGEKKSEYIHLKDEKEFNELIDSIGLNRLDIIADKIELIVEANGQIVLKQNIAQLKSNEEILVPFKLDNVLEQNTDIKLYISYVDKFNNAIVLNGDKTESLNDIVLALHTKKSLTDDMLAILNELQKLRTNGFVDSAKVIELNTQKLATCHEANHANFN